MAMRKIIAIFLVLVMIISLVACSKDDEKKNTDTYETNEGEYCFVAKVLERNESSLCLEITEPKNSNILEGTQAIISIKSEYPDCKKGDYVTVVFDGVVQESYPLQIPNVYSVTLADK